MAITWGSVFQVTDDTDDSSGGDFVYGPDRSVFVTYDILSPAPIEKRGVYLRKRKRDKTWLDPIKIDFMTGDSEYVDFITTSTNAASQTLMDRRIAVSSEGDVWVMWAQIGRGGSSNRALCFRKFAYNGKDDSYGTPSDVWYLQNGSTIGQGGTMAWNNVERRLWFLYNYGNAGYIGYLNPGDSYGNISAQAREQQLINGDGATGVVQNINNPYLDVDPEGNVHIVMTDATNAKWAIHYLYRSPGYPLRSATAPVANMLAPAQKITTDTGAAADKRQYLSVRGRSISNVQIGWTFIQSTANQIWVAEKLKTAGGGWSQTQLDDVNSTQPTESRLDGSDTSGYSLCVWAEKQGGALVDSVYHAEQVNGTWSAEVKGIARDSVATGIINGMRLHFKKYPKTPYQLGFQNPLLGRSGVLFLQNDL